MNERKTKGTILRGAGPATIRTRKYCFFDSQCHNFKFYHFRPSTLHNQKGDTNKPTMSSLSLTKLRLTIATFLLLLGAFGLAVSIDEEPQVLLDDEINFSPTGTPTLPVISVTLPAGVTAQDEDIADVIDSLIRGEPPGASNGQEENTSTSSRNEGLLLNTSRAEALFLLEILVSNNQELTNQDKELLEDLLEQYTVYFSPLPIDEVESKITSMCTVGKQVLLLDGEDSVAAILQVDIMISYESIYHDVTDYPKLFQDWTSSNLDVLLSQMQFLNMHVTSVDAPKRIVAPTAIPTTAPSSQNSVKPIAIYPELEDDNEVPSISPKESRWSATAIVVFSISVILAIGTLIVAISIFSGRRRDHDESMTDEDQERKPEEAEKENDDSCESTTITSGGISPRYYHEDTSCSLVNV